MKPRLLDPFLRRWTDRRPSSRWPQPAHPSSRSPGPAELTEGLAVRWSCLVSEHSWLRGVGTSCLLFDPYSARKSGFRFSGLREPGQSARARPRRLPRLATGRRLPLITRHRVRVTVYSCQSLGVFASSILLLPQPTPSVKAKSDDTRVHCADRIFVRKIVARTTDAGRSGRCRASECELGQAGLDTLRPPCGSWLTCISTRICHGRPARS